MILLIILGLLFQSSGAEIWKTFIFMNMILVGSHMLPFPQLAGGKMIFTSFYLFVFALALTVATIFLLLFIPAISAMILALVLAVITVIAVYFKRET